MGRGRGEEGEGEMDMYRYIRGLAQFIGLGAADIT